MPGTVREAGLNFGEHFLRWFSCCVVRLVHRPKLWIEDAMASLARGESVIIFPEGKRNKTGEGLLPFHGGVALLAERSGARIVPVYNAVWHFPRRYRLAIGEPYYLETPPDGVRNSDWLNKQTQIIQDSVAALAPKLENK